MSLLPEWTSIRTPIIGMLHAPALPGSPDYQGDFDQILEFVAQDAESLCRGGVDALMLENFGDTPFFPDRVPAITIAAMTRLAVHVRSKFSLPLGLNVLRNDGCSALAIAAATGASFIRVNVLGGARVTDQGIIQGIAHDLLRDRVGLMARGIKILADVDVKHSAPVSERPLGTEVRDMIERAHADAVIVSGDATGTATDINAIRTAKQAAGSTPIFVGSGVRVDNVHSLIAAGADGLIVGSSLKRDGELQNPIDPARVRTLIEAVRS